jgi:hypothetical protein
MKKSKMQLLCVGDMALSENTLGKWEWSSGEDSSWGKEGRVLVNWELPLGERINIVPRSSGPRLLANPSSVHVIERWSPGFATLATNHILDAGEEGLAATIDLLKDGGFETVGAGRTQEEITAPLFWETSDGRLAIVNWVFPETHPDWMAMPGPNCWPGPREAERTIQSLKKTADWVLVVVHWSDELFPYPRHEDRVIARQLAHAGADWVVGHHPHVVRGMEIIASCPVFYSVGNFYFSDFPDQQGGWVARQAPRNRQSLGVLISAERGEEPKFQIFSFWQKRSQTVLDSKGRAERRMREVSQPLRQFQGDEYAAWYKSRRARFDKWDYRVHFGIWQLGTRGLFLYPFRALRSHLHSGL